MIPALSPLLVTQVLKASAAGLTDGFSSPFGIVPNGIPHALRFVTLPARAVLTATPIDEPIVTVEMLDIYGVRVVTPPAISLAPYATTGSRLPLSAFCDQLCQDNAYPVNLRVQSLESQDNPHLRAGLDASLTLVGADATVSSGLASFEGLAIALSSQTYSTRVQLHAEFITERQVGTADENGTVTYTTETYNALSPHTSASFAVMRPVDPYGVRICQPYRALESNTAGACAPFNPGLIYAGDGFRGPIITFVDYNGTEVDVRTNNFGMVPIAGSIVVRVALVDGVTGAALPPSTMVGVTTLASERVFSTSTNGLVTRHVVDLAGPGLPLYFIEAAGTYSFEVTSFGLTSAVSPPIELLAGYAARILIDSVPGASQPWGEQLTRVGVAPGNRLLSVSLTDLFGNRNATSGVPILLELSGLARFVDGATECP